MEQRGDILVVDDSLTSRTLLAGILEEQGYRVRLAGDGQEALHITRQAPPELILLDLILPHLDGYKVTRRLRRDPSLPYIPIILITTMGDSESKVRGLEAGADDFVVKPPDEAELLARVGALLRLKRSQDALVVEKNKVDLLYQVSQELSAELDLDTLLTRILELTNQTIGASGGNIVLPGKRGGPPYGISTRQGEEPVPRQIWETVLEEGLAGWVLTYRQGVIVSDTWDDPRWIAIDEIHYRTRSALSVPLIRAGRVIGVMTLTHEEPAHFAEDHLDLANSIASQGAIVVENARLYTETEKERSKLAAILTGTADIVVVTDREGNILLLNPAAEETFDVQEEEVVSQPLREVLPNPALVELFERGAKGTPPHTAEVALNTNCTLYASISSAEGVGYVAVMRDITYLKELEEMKSEFVATVSHDLRSPLSTIHGYADMLARSLNGEEQEYARRIRIGTKQMAELIEDLLDLGRIEAGMEADYQPCQMDVLIEAAIDSARFQTELEGLSLTATISSPLPVLGNPGQLRQVLDNLIGNAIKYTPAGGKIEVRAWSKGDRVCVEVQDTGIGIPREAVPRLFEKFYRVPSAETKELPGTGLGLAIVKAIIDQHRGELWVKSTPRRGSTFGFSLPRHEGTLDEGRGEQP